MSPRRRAVGQSIGFVAHDANDRPVYVISVAAQLADMHPQTLRQYDRLGLVSPQRSAGRGRRYSHRDVEKLRRIQELSRDGINLAGIERILALEEQVSQMAAENAILRQRQAAVERVFAAARDGQVEVVAHAPGTRVIRRSR